MAKLLGNETSEANEISYVKEKPAACKYECTLKGELNEIKATIKQAAAEVETYDLGIYTDSSGNPGTLLEHHTCTSAASTTAQTITATGFKTKIVKGTQYHLAIVDKTAAVKLKYKKEAAHEDLRKEATAWTELKEAGTWSAENTESWKVTIWGLGVEESEVEVKEIEAKTKVKLKDSDALSQLQALEALTKVSFKDSLALAETLTLTGTVKVKLADSLSVLQASALAGATKVIFTDSLSLGMAGAVAIEAASKVKIKTLAAPVQLQTPSATSKVRFAATLSSGQVLTFQGTTAMRFKDAASALQAIQAAATGEMTFRNKVRVQMVETGGGRKIALFIFDE